MWSPSLGLLMLCSLITVVTSKIITTSYSSNGPVIFNTGGVALLTIPATACRDQQFTLASTSVDGATVSFIFTGTGITLNCMTDTDRGLYTITVDSGNSKTVSGISSSRSCTALYSISGLANVQHQFSLKTVSQSLVGSTSTSAKFEFMSFEVTVPDDPTPTTPLIPDGTPNTSSATTSATSVDSSASANLSGGTIAAIAVCATLGATAIVLGFFLFRSYRRIRALRSSASPAPQSFAPVLASPGPNPHTSAYLGHPELMAASPSPGPVSLSGSFGQSGIHSYTPPR